MTRIVEFINSEWEMPYREKQTIDLGAQANHLSPQFRAIEGYYGRSLSQDSIPPSRRSTEPPTKSSHRSAYVHSRLSNNFNLLPDALICRVADFLSPAAAVCLSTTCRRLKNLIRPKKSSLSCCERWFIMVFLEQDYIDHYPPQLSWRSLGHHRHLRHSSSWQFTRINRLDGFNGLTCALCKVKHGPEAWGQASPGFWTFTVQDLFKTKSIERIYSWHWRKLVFPIQCSFSSTTKIPRWVSSLQEMCMHCGQVQLREKCHCSATTSRAGQMYEECDIYSFRKVRLYVRPGTQEDFDSA